MIILGYLLCITFLLIIGLISCKTALACMNPYKISSIRWKRKIDRIMAVGAMILVVGWVVKIWVI